MDLAHWDRLADYMTSRRVELAPGTSREEFFATRDVKLQRIASDLENAKRQNFDRATFARVDAAYEWAPGSVRAILGGGEPTLLEGTPAASSDVNVPGEIERDPTLNEEARRHLLDQYDMLRRLSQLTDNGHPQAH